MDKVDSIRRLLENEKEIEEAKKGFPSIGNRKDGREFSQSIKRIADAWHIYDTELRKIKVDSKIKTIDLGGGNPLENKPFKGVIKNIKKTLKRKDLYLYQPASGDEKERKKFSEYLLKEKFLYSELNYENTIITVSTSHAFSLIIQTIAREYDVILMTAPNYGIFTFFPERLNVGVELIELEEVDDYYLNAEKLEKKINETNEKLYFEYKGKLSYIPRVVGFLNQNPHNPTGKVMSNANREILVGISDILLKNGIFLIDDLIYQEIVFDRKNKAIAAATLGEKYAANTITMFGLSKAYGVASFRAGCVVADKIVIRSLRNKLFQSMDSAPILQAAAMTGAYNTSIYRRWEYEKYFKRIIKKYFFRYNIVKALVEGIERVENINIKKNIIKLVKKQCKKDYRKMLLGIPNVNLLNRCCSEGGFFTLVDFSGIKGKQYKDYKIIDERSLLFYIYGEAKVKFIMGQSIGFEDEEKIIARISYALDEKELIEAFIKLNSLISNLK